MTTIREVAAHAKVSISTVSHVLNGTRYVDPETENRVRVAIDVLSYRRNSIARSLRRRETGTIGLIVPDNSHPFFAEMARAIEDAGYAQGYNVILGNSDRSESKEKTYINVLLSKQIDGLILMSLVGDAASLQLALDARVPVVAVDREIGDVLADQIVIDNEQGGYLAGQYLIALGHRRIGYIAGPRRLSLSAGRLTGFQRALSEADVELPHDAIIVGDFDYSSGEAAMTQFLARNLGLTAVFAASDVMAIGAINALHRAYMRVPEDISIIGFDDIPQARGMSPAITTIAQPILELGQVSVATLLERIKQRDSPPKRIVLPTRLIERESCRALNSNILSRELLNVQLAQIIAAMGASDRLIIGNATIAPPLDKPYIDLAVMPGLPRVIDVIQAVVTKLKVKRFAIATESVSSGWSAALEACLPHAHKEILPYEQIQQTEAVVVRTGDIIPYTSVILWN